MAHDLNDAGRLRNPAWHEQVTRVLIDEEAKAKEEKERSFRQLSMLQRLLPRGSRIFTVIRDRDNASYFVTVLRSGGADDISDITPTVASALSEEYDEERGFIRIGRGRGNWGMVLAFDLGFVLHDDPTSIRYTNL